MNKLIIIFVLFFCISCDKEPLIVDENSTRILFENGLVLHDKVPFSGSLISYYDNAEVKSKKQYVEGKLYGIVEKWYPDTKKQTIRFYKNGVKIGYHQAWWANGNTKFEFQFNKEGEHHGISNEYFEDGTPYKLFNYQYGKEEGTQKMFKPNGDLRANYIVVQGERFGLIGLKKCDAVSIK